MKIANEAPAKQVRWGMAVLDDIRRKRREHQDVVADSRNKWIDANRYFYHWERRLLRFIVAPESRVLEIRCLTGRALAELKPSRGVGVEIGKKIVEIAKSDFPHLEFVQADPEDLDLRECFDYIIFNHVFDTPDILRAFERVRRHCSEDTIFIISNYNQWWQPILELATKAGLRSKFVEPNWVNENDILGFLKLTDFRCVHKYRFLLFPKWIPVFSWVVNEFFARLPVLRKLCMMQVMVARPVRQAKRPEGISVSVVVPCRNEEQNIALAIERIPEMGKWTEIIFCDDKSTDGTANEVRRMQALHPDRNIRLVNGSGICKAENVWAGFRAARGDVLMILDADLAVMPEELPIFFKALVQGHGDFVNGSRLVYPMQKLAMKFANMIGNKLFGLTFSFLLDQRIKDTLCGTKVLWRKDWVRMEPHLGSWGERDLWGDYELLFGASRLQLEIVEVPVHYQERLHGVTKMTRVIANGWRMLRICWHAWRRLEG
jgi:SAM-dependent methyltransferase